MSEAQDNQALRDDIEKLKEKMDEMMAMKEQLANIMKLLERRTADEGTSSGNSENIATSAPPPHNSDGQGYQWPPYGLPAGYTPPTMDATLGCAPTGVVNLNHNVHPSPNEGPQVQNPVSAPIPLVASQSYTPPLVTSRQIPEHNLGNSSGPYIPNVNSNAIPLAHPYNYSTWESQPKVRYQMLEERLRAVEGSNTEAKDAHDLCLVPNVVIPPKFKVPDFDKYQGATCPASHLTMYCRKMTAFAHNDQLLIHYFQDSLAGAASSWYMQLKPTHIRSWKDLAEAFLKQYKYNMDMAPDRTQLQNMTKKSSESFKEYAQRWRGLAAQVVPPLSEREMVSTFMDTLQKPFYDKLIGSVSSNFSDMVTIGERVESGIRNGKIAHNSVGNVSGFPTVSTNKNGETNAIMDQGKPLQSSQRQGSSKFDPIPMSYTNLCNYLFSQNLISPRLMRPVQPPFPRGYDHKAKCDFHAGAVGHSTENCNPLKHLVQGLIDTKQLSFKEDDDGSTVSQNPQNSG